MKVVCYVATSRDGFIASGDGGVDWLPQYPDPEDQTGFQKLLGRISTIVMGRRSFDQTLGFGPWAWPDKTTWVMTRGSVWPPASSLPASVSFTGESPTALLDRLRVSGQAGDLWLFGGCEVIRAFAEAGQIDEAVITVVPCSIGSGIPLGFDTGSMTLVSTTPCMHGLVQNRFVRQKCPNT